MPMELAQQVCHELVTPIDRLQQHMIVCRLALKRKREIHSSILTSKLEKVTSFVDLPTRYWSAAQPSRTVFRLCSRDLQTDVSSNHGARF